MRVVFLYPSWTGAYGLFGYFAKRNSTWPPLNIALLAAIAEQHGHEVVIVDGEAQRMSQEKMVSHAFSLKPDLIGLTATSPFFHLNVSLAEALKKENTEVPIAVGGPHITIMQEKAFIPAFDYLFLGEAEFSFPRFLEVYEASGDISQVNGILYRKDNEIVSTGLADFIPAPPKGIHEVVHEKRYPLDRLPFPARHLLDMKRYRLGTMKGVQEFTSIQSMRGCPWQCIFCASKPLNTTRVIQRSPHSIVDEIKSVVTNHNTRHFYFVDDVLTLWHQHIIDICDLLDEEHLKITFEGSTRANLVSDELMARMARSGLVRLSFGLETVDTEMRKTMQKKVSLEAYTTANRICDKYGIEALNSVMIGLPGETRETVRTTLAWLRDAREVKQANFAIAVPYPGTKFHEMALSGTQGVSIISEDFSEYLRYGSAVTRVGELSPEDLIELQNEGFVSIYSAPWRWIPVMKKHGILGLLLQLIRVAKIWRKRIFGKAKPLHEHPKVSW